jgi:hypothetical protein
MQSPFEHNRNRARRPSSYSTNQVAECESVEVYELKGRIHKWLRESQRPDTASCGSCSDLTDDEFEQPACVLYHPDFVEWKSLDNHHQERRPSESAAGLQNIFDEAQASISSFLRLSSS